MDERKDEKYSAINAITLSWKQGDCIISKCDFFYQINPQMPITSDVENFEDNIIAEAVVGFCVLTQTCDIVRDCKSRHFLEVAPLVEVDQERLDQIQKGLRPAYAFVPGVAGKMLVADLDRVMTIEKSCLIKWERVEGCGSDQEQRLFAEALTRKRSRFAFPDEFNCLVSELQSRIKKKHGKDSTEGIDLRNLREIRVRAAPSWQSKSTVELMFYFIQDNLSGAEDKLLKSLLSQIPANDRFKPIDGIICTLDDLTAKDYIESDRLDLDYLSIGQKSNRI